MSGRGAGARGFWPLRDLPVVLWLAAAVVVALVHPFVPAPRWLMLHLLLLGAVSHAILVWSSHFAAALLRTSAGPGERGRQSARLLLLNAGVLLVVVGVVGDVWALTVAGATAVAGAVLWHGAALGARLRRSLPARFRSTVRYYLLAACFLPVGALLGTLLARGLAGPAHEQLTFAHAATNLLGWIGLTVAGTLVTLWPTMLRTRIADGAERAARRALPVMAGAVVVTVGGALAGLQLVAAAGVLGYLAGLGGVAVGLVPAARAKPPTTYATASVLAGLVWWAACLLLLAAAVATAPDWQEAGDRLGQVTPYLAVGFAAQVLLGALSYLVPVALGGGPAAVRAATAVLDAGSGFRVVAANAALLVCVLPVPSTVRVACSVLVLLSLAAFLPLLLLALRASRATRPGATGSSPPDPRQGPVAAAGVRPGRPRGQLTGMAATGLAAVVVAVAVGVGADPTALAGTAAPSAAAGTSATGRTTTVQVEAADMAFVPSRIEVPAGDRLVVEVTNTDPEGAVHDLVLNSGADSGRLAPGASAVLDLGVVGRDLTGWCSVVGHRQMGMVLTVEVTRVGEVAGGTAGTEAPDLADAPADGAGAAADLRPGSVPGPGFEPYDAVLPPLTDERVRRHVLRVSEVETEVAPGVRQTLWTFGGTAPGPVLHGRVGDVFEVTLVNDGSIGHSIDFHAGALAPDGPMRTIAPGESLVYRFEATRAGIWLYHCSTAPMSAHMANGMVGAVVIEPDGLPEVDRSYLLVQSELYLGEQGGAVDVARLRAEEPDLVVFNGYADQYGARPLAAEVGERLRVWVLDAGPNRSSAFHVVGGQFDTVYLEGAYRLGGDRDDGQGGSQVLALAPAQGGFVELVFPEAGRYPFVSHVMVDAERGAHGVFEVGPG